MNIRAPRNRTTRLSSPIVHFGEPTLRHPPGEAPERRNGCRRRFLFCTKPYLRILAVTVLAAVHAGCDQKPNRPEGVELILSSTSPIPAMPLELRFDQA